MRIAVVGSGNVATHLACGLAKAGHVISGVWSRTSAHALELAGKVGAIAYASPEQIAQDRPDVVLFSVADGGAAGLIETFPPVPGAVVLHTSGTLPQEILMPVSADCGILYPLQTFSKGADVILSEVPFFIEGATPKATDVARELAESLSRDVHYADAAHRKKLHIAGVLSCNFPNYLWECCQKLLAEAGYPLSVLEPLVRATVDKAFAMGPHAAQTGPARRGDRKVMTEHAESLQGPLSDVYRTLSEEIYRSHYE